MGILVIYTMFLTLSHLISPKYRSDLLVWAIWVAPWSVISLHHPTSTVSIVILYLPMAIRAIKHKTSQNQKWNINQTSIYFINTCRNIIISNIINICSWTSCLLYFDWYMLFINKELYTVPFLFKNHTVKYLYLPCCIICSDYIWLNFCCKYMVLILPLFSKF